MRLTMTVRDWQLVDATMDNVGATARETGGEDDVAAAADAVRRAGWDQVATHRPANGGWPPSDARTSVDLSPELWSFVAPRLEYWATLLPPWDEAQAEADRRCLAIARLIRSTVGQEPGFM